MAKAGKPLGGKAYGSIPHLLSSRLGSGDHHCHEGQDRILTEKARDKHDRVIVREKLDGSCVAVAKIDGVITPLVRAGYPAQSSPFEQHHLFADWTYEWQHSFDICLGEGERFCGEWLALAHGTRYNLPGAPFVPFDLIDANNKRVAQVEFSKRVPHGLKMPRLIHYGGPISVEEVKAKLEPSGHGALDPVEGAVWRVERRGEFDFMAKWVRPEKKDGCYFKEATGRDIWNWRPLAVA